MRRLIVPLLLVAGLAAAPAEATRVVDVRVGAHPGYTRVVLQLDAASDYRIRRQQIPAPSGEVTELAIELDGATGAFALGGRRGIVESVRVKPQGSGAVALIRLSVSSPRVADMTLKNPHRIVIDVRPPTKQAKAAPPPAPPPPPPPPPAPKLQAEPTPLPPAELPEEASGQAAVEDAPEADEGEEGASDEEPGAAAPEGLPGGRAPAPMPPPPRPAPAAQPTGVPEASGGGVGFMPIVGVLGVLLLGWLFLRRRSQSYIDQPGEQLSDFPPVESLGEEAVPGDAVSEEDLALPEVQATVDDEDDLPAMPGQPIPPRPAAAPQTSFPEPPELEPAPAQEAFPGLGATPTPGAEDGLGRSLQEVERRMRHLETRLEEVADARERTDRQMAAHTEELRVQRSAIARAQRVLRNLTRPDEPTEPIPKPEDEGP